jgi:UDP-2,3-diacylglucosamine hydrolase
LSSSDKPLYPTFDTGAAPHRVYLASDVHLGAPSWEESRERETAFVAWIERAAADGATAIHIVGDLFDFWFEYKRAIPKGGVRIQGALARITDTGIPVHFHIGNHDLWTFGYLESELGLTVHRLPTYFTYDGLRCLVGHGDGLGPDDKSFKRLRRLFHARFPQRVFRCIHPDWGIRLAEKWSRGSRASGGFSKASAGIAKTPTDPKSEWLWQYAVEMTQAGLPVDCFIFGHRHLALDLDVPGGTRYINLGEWIEARSSATILDGKASLVV